MSSKTHAEINTRASKIKLLLLDVDGILSDGKLYFSNSGEEIKTFHTLDGQGIKLLQKSGVKIGIITGRSSDIVRRRAENLGIDMLVQGREDKLSALTELLQAETFELEEIAHMGDDLPDLAIIRRVGLGLTVPNAHPELQKYAHWQSQKRGGEGAVREACDLILKAQNNYQTAIAEFL